MSDLRALAEAANRPAPPSMHHGFINDDYLVWEAARRAFEEAATPFAVLALLDAAEARAEAEMEYADCWQEGDRLRARLALMEAVVGKVPLLLSVISSGEHLSQREYNEVRAALAAIEGSKP